MEEIEVDENVTRKIHMKSVVAEDDIQGIISQNHLGLSTILYGRLARRNHEEISQGSSGKFNWRKFAPIFCGICCLLLLPLVIWATQVQLKLFNTSIQLLIKLFRPCNKILMNFKRKTSLYKVLNQKLCQA